MRPSRFLHKRLARTSASLPACAPSVRPPLLALLAAPRLAPEADAFPRPSPTPGPDRCLA